MKFVLSLNTENKSLVHYFEMEGSTSLRTSEKYLFSAVESGKLHDVKLMLGNLTVNPRDKNGVTLLHRAARSGQNEILQYLLSSGRFRPTATDKYGWTALHWAAWHGHCEVVQSLMRVMARNGVNCLDRTGSTPLHLACLQGHDGVVRQLVSANCDINMQRKDSWCSLQLAVWNGHLSVVEELLKHGADPNKQTNDGMGPIHLASKKGFVKILECLLKRGRAAIDMQDKNGNTSLHEAVKNDFLDVVQILIEKECRINVRNKLGQTPMDIASVNGFSNIVILLAGLQHMLPRVPSVACRNEDDMKMLLMTLDANCTIRNSDIQLYSNDSVYRAGRLCRQKLRVDRDWELGRAKATAMGVVANYEQRIKEIEDPRSIAGKPESPKQFYTQYNRFNRSISTRVPSAPLGKRPLQHNVSLLSL